MFFEGKEKKHHSNQEARTKRKIFFRNKHGGNI